MKPHFGEIAGLAQVEPFDGSLELITRYVPRLTAAGNNPVQMIVDQGRDLALFVPLGVLDRKHPQLTRSKLCLCHLTRFLFVNRVMPNGAVFWVY